MKSYLCRRCQQVVLVGTPKALQKRQVKQRAKERHGLLARVFRRRKIRRELAEEVEDGFLAVPYRYNKLPGGCPKCGFRGERRGDTRARWWEPGMTYDM